MFNFKIGADPEFLFYHNNRMAPADKTINLAFKNKSAKYAPTGMGYKVASIGELGWDGASATGELRPSPNSNPMTVAQNVGSLFKIIHENVPYLTMTSLSIGSPIGGHIHLEVPADHELLEPSSVRQAMVNKIIATYLTPIVASEHKISTALRFGTNGYGKLDDIRIQNPTEDVTTYEVRGASAEWTCHPKIAEATLAYLGVIWHEILTKKTAALIRPATTLKSQQQVTAVHTLLLSEYTPVLDGLIESLHKTVQTFEKYPEYKAEVDLIFDVAKCAKMKEDVGWNINRGWNLTGTSIESPIQLTKRTFLSNKKTVANMKKIDFDALDQYKTGVVFNDDFNMGQFMSTLGERLTAFDVSLKNEYYFFGLRKGANNFLIAKKTIASDEPTLYQEAPTNVEKKELTQIVDKMASRYSGSRTGGKSIKLNPLTGKNINSKKQNIVFVGIPYETRAEVNIKPFLSKIWDVEHESTVLKKLEELPTPIMPKQEEEDKNKIPDELLAVLRDETEQDMPSCLDTNN